LTDIEQNISWHIFIEIRCRKWESASISVIFHTAIQQDGVP